MPRYLLGQHRAAAGRLNDAQRLFRKVLRAKLNDSETLRRLAWIAQRKGNNAEAMQLLKRAIHNAPAAEVGPLLDLAPIQFGTGDLQGAETTLRSALLRDADNHIALARASGQ